MGMYSDENLQKMIRFLNECRGHRKLQSIFNPQSSIFKKSSIFNLQSSIFYYLCARNNAFSTMRAIIINIFLILTLLLGGASKAFADGFVCYGVDRLGSSTVTAIAQTPDGLLWVGTTRGLLRFDGYRFTRVPLHPADGSVRPAEISSFFIDRDTRLWVGMDHGLALYDSSTDGFCSVAFPDSLMPRVARIGLNSAGQLFAGTMGYGTFVVDINTLQALPATARLPWPDQPFVESLEANLPPDVGLNIEDNRLMASLRDRSGNLWLGVQRQGLLLLTPRHKPLFSALNTDDSALDTRSQHLLRPVQQPPATADALFFDPSGTVWLGSADALWLLRSDSASWQRVEGLPQDRVNVICPLDEEVLAVSVYGEGLALVKRATGQVARLFTMHDADSLGRGRLCNDWIISLATDPAGRLWIATSSGTCCYDPAADRFLTDDVGVIADGEQCTALCALASGDVLIASEHGLIRRTLQGKLRPEQGTEALQGKSIASIIEDAAADIWLSSDDGLWRWSPRSHSLVSYAHSRELLQHEFMQAPAMQSPAGSIFFRTVDGFLEFHPDSVRAFRREAGEVHLTNFRIGDTPASMLTRSNGKPVMLSPVTECRSFDVSYVDATFSLEFSLLDFTDVEGVSFTYRMDGDRQWQQLSKGENTIFFNHLAPGTYRLHVRALADGEVTPTAYYLIRVRPPWWRSPLAYIIYVLILAALAAAAVVTYRRYTRNRLNEEKLHLLMSAINTANAPLSLDDMRRAIGSFVQNRQEQQRHYGSAENALEQMDLQQLRGNDEQLMDRVIQSINRHLDDSEFSVEQLCTEVGISRAHLHRKMKELTGMPVTEFIRNIRLEQAARLLREHKLNVTQVAYSVGFSNIGYFSTVFRKRFGVSPRDFA